jgi:hypothetical protein
MEEKKEDCQKYSSNIQVIKQNILEKTSGLCDIHNL